MARSKGSLSSAEAKAFSQEMTMLAGTPYKYNFDLLRLISILICQRISENVCSYPSDEDICNKIVTVEIPLIGDLTVKPRVFHEKHGMTDKPSIHFDFDFKPSSSFKSSVYKAYIEGVSDIPDIFSGIYGEQLKEVYHRMREG